MIFSSHLPDVSIPEVPLPEFVLQRAQAWGDKPAIIDAASSRSLTFAQVAARAQKVAAGLAARGFGKGDVFAIYCPNLPEFALALYGTLLAGGTVTTINPLYSVDELVFQLNDAGAKFLLTVPPFLDKALAARERSGVKEVFVLGEAEGAIPFAHLLAAEGPPPEVTVNSCKDVALLPYSSGTTGLPKGVMLTHYGQVANLCQIVATGLATEQDTVLMALPLFHLFGLSVLAVNLYIGTTVVTLPRFELEPFLRAIQECRVTFVPVVPPIVQALAYHPLVEQYDLSSLRLLLSGAAPLDPRLEQACVTRLGCLVIQAFGMTETGPATHITPLQADKIRPGSVGVPIPNTQAKVVDIVTGETLPPGEQGEICVRGPQLMKGYLNNPEATAATIDADGWLHTGDIGYADSDGYFYVVDRLKELIKYKGMQVAPAELEGILLSHPAVADAAVIPSPDEEAGEVPKAFVVLKEQATPQALMAYVAERVAPHKKVRQLEVVEQIPKSPTGKILRRVLVARERQQAGVN